ncbi:MAG: 30S ribosome-binding factor RbfA [Chloroflexi bacterium]|nr:30S ribosome-binding factor RbfA [Chloroflexota bacterium]
MVGELRLRRIEERMKEELAEIFLFEVSDPRLQGVNVTDVDVDRELAYADIYVSAVEGEARKDEILRALEHAKGYLRTMLAQRMAHLRTFPRLRFHWDPTPERAARLEKLFAQLEAERRASQDAEPSTEAEDTGAEEAPAHGSE